MAPFDNDVLAAVDAQREAIEEVIAFVHAHPELAHEERECAAELVRRLRGGGLQVWEGVGEMDTGVGEMDTAFRAVLSGARPGRRVGIVCQYDAVAAVRDDGSIEAVHSCGHGPIAGSVVGAALALASLR